MGSVISPARHKEMVVSTIVACHLIIVASRDQLWQKVIMDIQQIDLGENYVRTCLQDSKTLVIGFESGGGKVERPEENKPAWAQRTITNAGWDGLFILPKKMNWYQSPELWDFFKSMKATGFFANYERVVMYGSSMGGFGALAFSKLAGAELVVAIHPRTTLVERDLPWKSGFSRKLTYNQRGPRADVLHGLSPKTKVMIFVDPLKERDKSHADRVARRHANTDIVRVPLGGHGLPTILANLGILREAVTQSIAGEFDKKWFYQELRRRRELEAYHRNLKQAILRRSKLKGSVIEE